MSTKCIPNVCPHRKRNPLSSTATPAQTIPEAFAEAVQSFVRLRVECAAKQAAGKVAQANLAKLLGDLRSDLWKWANVLTKQKIANGKKIATANGMS